MTCEVVYKFKPGSSLRIPMHLQQNSLGVDITGWTITSEVRYGSKLIAPLQVQMVTPSVGQFNLLASPSVTKDFPLKPLECDVMFTKTNGDVVHSPTFILDVERGVTAYVGP